MVIMNWKRKAMGRDVMGEAGVIKDLSRDCSDDQEEIDNNGQNSGHLRLYFSNSKNEKINDGQLK